MGARDQLTNQFLKGLFKNNFELANYAIRLGRYYLKSGREIAVDSLLEEIRRNPSEQYLRDLESIDAEEREEE
jgi:hypothetical protein